MIAIFTAQDETRRLRCARGSLGHHLGKVVSWNVLHHEKLTFTFSEMIADAWQCPVMESRKQTSFTFELFTQPLVSEKSFFQRDSGIKAFIHSFIHRAHATLPKLAHNFVATLQNCIWRQHFLSKPC